MERMKDRESQGAARTDRRDQESSTLSQRLNPYFSVVNSFGFNLDRHGQDLRNGEQKEKEKQEQESACKTKRRVDRRLVSCSFLCFSLFLARFWVIIKPFLSWISSFFTNIRSWVRQVLFYSFHILLHSDLLWFPLISFGSFSILWCFYRFITKSLDYKIILWKRRDKEDKSSILQQKKEV